MHMARGPLRRYNLADGNLEKEDHSMGDKSPKNTAKTKKQKSQKKAGASPKPMPKK